jgi:hypothetical protein
MRPGADNTSFVGSSPPLVECGEERREKRAASVDDHAGEPC